jgi:hypothetical protein
MPLIIDSAPSCVTHHEGGTKYAQDGADFILQANYQDCAGFMTFGPGSTYGDGGTGAGTAYMALTWIGIVFMVVALVGWMAYENHRLLTYAAKNALGIGRAPTDEPPPQPGMVD